MSQRLFPRRTALFLTLALCAAPAFAAESISKVNGSITAEAGQAYGELETVNGSIRIAEGATTADAGTVNGSISVGDKATVGSLETVNGGIKLDRGVSVDGDLETVNGSIFVDRGGKVKGGAETVNGPSDCFATRLGDIRTGSNVPSALSVLAAACASINLPAVQLETRSRSAHIAPIRVKSRWCSSASCAVLAPPARTAITGATPQLRSDPAPRLPTRTC